MISINVPPAPNFLIFFSWIRASHVFAQVGTFADVVIADAVVKDIKGFDLDVARDAMLKDVSVRVRVHTANIES